MSRAISAAWASRSDADGNLDHDLVVNERHDPVARTEELPEGK
jgi:hypothetical protein